MNAQFQSLFENVCRCFGHTPTSRGGGTAGQPMDTTESIDENERKLAQVNSQVSSHDGKRRTNQLKLNDQQYDELFEKTQNANSRNKSPQKQQTAGSAHSRSSYKQPPRPDGYGTSSKTQSSKIDNETAQALAQAKLAANPPRYRVKRKRSSQTREEIFRNKKGIKSNKAGKSGSSHNNSDSNHKSSSSSKGPQTDFARLLNPSLALCFATPIRGTEEEQEEQDVRSLDCSDTATLNTNGEDTITSTLYFDSKYAHIQESTPPMKLFHEFKIGQAKDEIRTIMATDSHSSVRMLNILQKQQQIHPPQHPQQSSQREHRHAETVFEEGEGESSSNNEKQKKQRRQHGSSKGNRASRSSHQPATDPASMPTPNRRTKETITISSDLLSAGGHRDEEMEDAVPDVKPLSSSTDSSRLSTAAATRHQ
mmetsp:Transcript_4020/g.11484  ORF Transcript_4020/g.11484 Transcript_4020/m.11484 type:complete len:423 (+) Transcript_4020:1804-3072(+)|eukprot:CAMPEP_0172362790 /NCGR_PEP_ID=MMETSP1060-20121228/6322_1 /TAXON_ID=37318 /ORGANISM="Pseudo-nitzschia pungens, Strain cf. cingulata" /LENGTH=422 /DNA_ID=CAMNT_0013085377 /DNA_START=540 /DNA_END=1808 /DNA_ORIENTATION=+